MPLRRPPAPRLSRSVAGRHAIVTGGSSGIGLATARELLARGAAVSVIARDQDRIDAAVGQLRAFAESDDRAHGASADVSRPAPLEAAIGTLVERSGPCDVLVTSAGVARPGYFRELPDHAFREAMEVNYFGTLHAIRTLVPSMIDRSGGSIVGVSSAAALVGVFGYGAYGPSKYAVRGLLEGLRVELAPHGISVGCAFPPDTDTPQLHHENRLKPPETHAVSGTIKPLTAERVARSLVDGIERGDPWIIADLQTRMLARGAGLLRGSLLRYFDRAVRRAGDPK